MYRLGPIYQKVNRTSRALEYFTLNEWIYRNDNFLGLGSALCTEDKELFHIDVREIDWEAYMENYVVGVRHYLLKEDPKTIESAKFRLDLLYYATQVTKLAVAAGSSFLAYRVVRKINDIRKVHK